jgi:hypothetical protein
VRGCYGVKIDWCDGGEEFALMKNADEADSSRIMKPMSQ